MKTAPLKYLASVTLGKMLQAGRPKTGQTLLPYLKASSITEHGLDLSNLQEMPFSHAEQSHLDLRRDDVVVVEGGSIGRSAYISEDLPGVHFQNAVNRIRPRENVDGRYLRYAIEVLRSSGYFETVTNLATIRHLTAEKLAQSPIPVHTFADQHMIAEFLDHEIAEIDKLIVDFQRLLNLWDERMESLADSAFSDVPCRLSKMKYLIHGLETGTSVKSAQFEPRQGEPGVLATSAVYSEEYDPSAVKSVDEDEIPRLTCPIRRKTLLMSRMNTPGLVGKAVTVDRDTPNIYLPDRLWQIDLDVPRYLYWWTRSTAYRDEVKLLAVGASSSMKTLSQQDFMSMKVPVPNVDTQQRVARRLDTRQAYVHESRSNILRAIDLIKERRAALISAAVTGQLDVTQKRKPLEEVLEDEVGVRV